MPPLVIIDVKETGRYARIYQTVMRYLRAHFSDLPRITAIQYIPASSRVIVWTEREYIDAIGLIYHEGRGLDLDEVTASEVDDLARLYGYH